MTFLLALFISCYIASVQHSNEGLACAAWFRSAQFIAKCEHAQHIKLLPLFHTLYVTLYDIRIWWTMLKSLYVKAQYLWWVCLLCCIVLLFMSLNNPCCIWKWDDIRGQGSYGMCEYGCTHYCSGVMFMNEIHFVFVSKLCHSNSSLPCNLRQGQVTFA